MKVAIGSTTLASGTLANQPARLVSGRGARMHKAVPLIGATAPHLRDLGNITYTDVIEADYTYTTPKLAQAAILSLREAALTATGNLVYGDGASATTIGPALCIAADATSWDGCGVTMRYEILATKGI